MNEEEQALPPQEAAPASAPSTPEGVAAPEISRRVGSILDAVEREAARLREEARTEAGVYLDNARRRADGLVAERQRRIGELSDELIAKSEAVIARLDDAAPVRQGFENLVRALGDAAERLANEAEGGAGDFEPPAFGTTPVIPGQGPPTPSQPVHQDHYAPAPGNPYAAPAQPQYSPAPQQPVPAQHPGAAQPVVHAPEQPANPSRPHTGGGWLDDGRGPAFAAQQSPGNDPGWREQDEARMVAIQMAASGATRGAVREHLHRALGLAETGSVLDEVFGPGSGEDAQVPWTSSRR